MKSGLDAKPLFLQVDMLKSISLHKLFLPFTVWISYSFDHLNIFFSHSGSELRSQNNFRTEILSTVVLVLISTIFFEKSVQKSSIDSSLFDSS